MKKERFIRECIFFEEEDLNFGGMEAVGAFVPSVIGALATGLDTMPLQPGCQASQLLLTTAELRLLQESMENNNHLKIHETELLHEFELITDDESHYASSLDEFEAPIEYEQDSKSFAKQEMELVLLVDASRHKHRKGFQCPRCKLEQRLKRIRKLKKTDVNKLRNPTSKFR